MELYFYYLLIVPLQVSEVEINLILFDSEPVGWRTENWPISLSRNDWTVIALTP